MVIRKGIARGRAIELDEPLPFGEGQALRITAEPLSEPIRGATPAEILRAVREGPHVDPSEVDELERAIASGRLPVRGDGPFDAQP